MKINLAKEVSWTKEDLHEPMRWKKFRSKPLKFQIEYVEYMKTHFHANQKAIAEQLFNIHVSTFCKYNTDVLNVIFYGDRMTKDEKRKFSDFVSRLEIEEDLMLATTKRDVDYSTQLPPKKEPEQKREMPIVLDDAKPVANKFTLVESEPAGEEKKKTIRRVKNPNFKPKSTRTTRMSFNFDGEFDLDRIVETIKKNVPSGSDANVYIDIKF